VSTLLQISDPHFGTEQPPVVAALLELARHLKPDLVLLSGDITQRARRDQFAAAAAFVAQLPPAPVLAIPGNHDIPLFNIAARLFTPYANFQRAFGDELEPFHDGEHMLVIGVNTTRPRRHKDGEVSEEQIESVATRLRSARAHQLRVVVVHQPVHVIRVEDLKNLLHGHEHAVMSWSAAGADLIVGGHIHLPYVRPLSDHFADLPRRVWAVQAGTAVSHRVRHEAPNSVNVIRHDLKQVTCEIERWDFAASSREFRCAEMLTVELDRRAAGGQCER
jgi:3',5'-cyclic AMP phosphodiesterase CpdA